MLLLLLRFLTLIFFYNLKVFDTVNHDKVSSSVTIDSSFVSALTHLGQKNFVTYTITNSQIKSDHAGALFPIIIDCTSLGTGKFEINNSEIIHGNTTLDCGIKNDPFFKGEISIKIANTKFPKKFEANLCEKCFYCSRQADDYFCDIIKEAC